MGKAAEPMKADPITKLACVLLPETAALQSGSLDWEGIRFDHLFERCWHFLRIAILLIVKIGNLMPHWLPLKRSRR